MGIHSVPGVAVEPSITLRPWLVVECDNGERHLIGFQVEWLEGRVSTAIKEFDRSTMTVKTSSGRLYRLEGTPALDLDGSYVWAHYAAANRVTAVRDVTAEYYEGWVEKKIVDTRADMVKAAMEATNRGRQ